ncbi:AAA family ATPase [Desulfobacterales bacterium HSG16]|nr:AAA family ATPase [Desulfobacterales bacterium HSG16]
MTFSRAERMKSSMKIAITGPSGSGKTHSALKIASGLANDGKIMLADTEHKSARLEAGKPGIPDFYVTHITPPYTSEAFVMIMDEAIAEGASVLIIDTLSHEWEGEGGILDQKEALDASKTRVNSWAQVMHSHNFLKNRMLTFPIHLIVTLRTRTEWVIHDKRPVKIGMKPVHKEGLEYDFGIVFHLDQETHNVQVIKDRTSLFDGQGEFVPSEDTGAKIFSWFNKGAGPSPEETYRSSLEKLTEVIFELERIKNLDDLTEWYKNNENNIKKNLTEEHWQIFVRHCMESRVLHNSNRWMEWSTEELDKICSGEQFDLWCRKNFSNIMRYLIPEARDRFQRILDDKRFDLNVIAA